MFVSLSPLVAIFVIFDCLACTGNGVLRALAMQLTGGTLSLIGYYIIAVPLALFLGFKMNLELMGLWIGNGAGLLFVGVSEIIVIYNIKWDSILERSKKLAMHEGI